MNVVAIDPGKDGGVCYNGLPPISMPIVKILVKPAKYVFARDADNNKIKYKGGDKAGEYKKVIKTKAKYDTELDCKGLYDIMKTADILVVEQAGNSIGNSARSTATTHYNIGKLHAIAEVCNCKIVIANAAKWKRDLGVDKDKTKCVAKACKLSGYNLITARGKLLDGPAEAWLIWHWYLTKYKEK